jgi:hypothetical protein
MSTWDRLLSAVFSNELHPKVATRVVSRLGLKPLLPPSTYDPMTSPRWGLAEAIAWAAWGDVEVGRTFSPEYRCETYYWRELTHKGRTIGWHPTPLEPPTWTNLKLAENIYPVGDRPNSFGAVDRAWKQIRILLTEARIPTAGVDRSGNVREIPPHVWHYLELSDSPTDGGLRASFRRVRFDDVTMPRESLLNELDRGLDSNASSHLEELPRVQRAIAETAATLWPKGAPLGLSEKEKHDLIIERLKEEHGFRARPSAVTIRRALRAIQPK